MRLTVSAALETIINDLLAGLHVLYRLRKLVLSLSHRLLLLGLFNHLLVGFGRPDCGGRRLAAHSWLRLLHRLSENVWHSVRAIGHIFELTHDTGHGYC